MVYLQGTNLGFSLGYGNMARPVVTHPRGNSG
jgi:hypothetical protein